MKKVWILEKFVSNEEMNKSLESLKSLQPVTEEQKRCLEDQINAYEKRMQDNPAGYWCGYVGKSNYTDFCYDAKQTMRHFKEGQFRVVRAEIEDGAKYWLGYVNPVENAGVLRYLYATL